METLSIYNYEIIPCQELRNPPVQVAVDNFKGKANTIIHCDEQSFVYRDENGNIVIKKNNHGHKNEQENIYSTIEKITYSCDFDIPREQLNRLGKLFGETGMIDVPEVLRTIQKYGGVIFQHLSGNCNRENVQEQLFQDYKKFLKNMQESIDTYNDHYTHLMKIFYEVKGLNGIAKIKEDSTGKKNCLMTNGSWYCSGPFVKDIIPHEPYLNLKGMEMLSTMALFSAYGEGNIAGLEGDIRELVFGDFNFSHPALFMTWHPYKGISEKDYVAFNNNAGDFNQITDDIAIVKEYNNGKTHYKLLYRGFEIPCEIIDRINETHRFPLRNEFKNMPLYKIYTEKLFYCSDYEIDDVYKSILKDIMEMGNGLDIDPINATLNGSSWNTYNIYTSIELNENTGYLHLGYDEDVYRDDPIHSIKVPLNKQSGNNLIKNVYDLFKREGYVIPEDKNGNRARYYLINKNTNTLSVLGKEVPGIDAKTFTVLDNASGYAKDKNGVYFFGQKILGADVKTFEVIRGYFGKDTKAVYFLGKPIPGADPKTFEVLDGHYGRDKNNIYYEYSALSLDDTEKKSFQVIKGSLYATTHKRAFFREIPLDFVDMKTFEVLSYQGNLTGYAKDQYNVYFWGIPLNLVHSSIDPKDFQLIGIHIPGIGVKVFGIENLGSEGYPRIYNGITVMDGKDFFREIFSGENEEEKRRMVREKVSKQEFLFFDVKNAEKVWYLLSDYVMVDDIRKFLKFQIGKDPVFKNTP